VQQAKTHILCSIIFSPENGAVHEIMWKNTVTSNILARRRNGTETWRRRSCQCEHLRLITHEKILLNGDVPRRNGNVTYSVNQP